MKTMIVVTHLLGTGHLRRALTLARAFADAGNETLLVSGGLPLPDLDVTGLTFLQLPPLRSDGVNFSRLLDETGQPASQSLFTKRLDLLCSALESFAPDVLITELFPFGRRVLGDEFLALLKTAKSLQFPPMTLASVRDILAPPSNPDKAARADDVVAQFYDAVLVHSDPTVTLLNASWPVSEALAQRLRYTGYVAPIRSEADPDGVGSGEVLVSTGGGSVGTALFETAISTAQQMPEQRWRLLVGGNDAPQRVTALKSLVNTSNIVIEAIRADFRQMLANATASISLCGYNTALDILQSGVPAVFIPFDDGNEIEQSLRADSLAHLNGIAVLPAATLSPDTLHDHLAQVIAVPRRNSKSLQFDGAQQSVAIATQMAKART